MDSQTESWHFWAWSFSALALRSPMKIDAQKLYRLREAADFLRVHEETVKMYCRRKSLLGRQIGPRKKWYVFGSAIIKKRKEWGIDQIED